VYLISILTNLLQNCGVALKTGKSINFFQSVPEIIRARENPCYTRWSIICSWRYREIKGIVDESKAVGHSSCGRCPHPGIAASLCILPISQLGFCQQRCIFLKLLINLQVSAVQNQKDPTGWETYRERKLRCKGLGSFQRNQFVVDPRNN